MNTSAFWDAFSSRTNKQVFYLKHHIELNMIKHKSCHWVLSQLYCLEIIPYGSVMAVKIIDVLLILLIFFVGFLFGFLKPIVQLFSWQKMMFEIVFVLCYHISVCKDGSKVKDSFPHWSIWRYAWLSLNGEITLVVM